MQTSLREGATRFRQDFNREFIRLLNFQMVRYHRRRILSGITSNVSNDESDGAHARLINDVFVVLCDARSPTAAQNLSAS